MKYIDRLGQRWRIDKVLRFIPEGKRILDIGSADGALFQRLGTKVGPDSMGIDPSLKANGQIAGATLVAGKFPQDMPAVEPFDLITLLAVLEHFPPGEYATLEQACRRLLKPGGRLIITVPSAHADYVLALMTFFKVHDGMSLEEHHGYNVDDTPKIFPEEHFRLLHRETFEWGLNNLFIFERKSGID